MKTKCLIFAIALLLTTACSKDDGGSGNDPLPNPENHAPESFSLMNVADGSVDVQPNPTFSWDTTTDPDGDTVTYDFFLDTQAEPQIKMDTDIETTTFKVPDSLALCRVRTYYWKVVAKDGKGGETPSEIFSFTTRTLNDAEQITNKGDFSKRNNHASVVFNDEMWVLGGFVNQVASNDNRKSTGADWAGLGSATSELYTERFFHSAVSFSDKIWITGGVVADFANDVWNTPDGKVWTQLNQDQEYIKRAEHTLTVFAGKLWIIGGSNGDGKLADVWSSADGATWERIVEEAPFGKRNFHQTVALNGKLWVIGGFDDVGAKNDVWSSTDGSSWIEETPNAQFSPRGFHKTLVFDDKIWVIGSGTENDIWYSEDGVEWFDASPENSFPAKDGFTALFYKGKIWILGGSNTNEVWEIDYSLGQSD
jgi:hypothetical protein